MAKPRWNGSDGNWGTAGNWAVTAAVPLADDDVSFDDDSVVDVTAGLDQTGIGAGAGALDSLNFSDKYTGDVGTSSDYLQIDTDYLNYEGKGSGAYFDIGANVSTVATINTSSMGANAVNLKGAIGDLAVLGGNITAAEAMTTIHIGAAQGANDVTFTLSTGATVTTINTYSGSSFLKSVLTTLNVYGGVVTLEEITSGTVTTVNVYGGTFLMDSTRTITTLTIRGSGVADFSNFSRQRTVTNCLMYDDGVLDLRTGNKDAVTFTNGIILRGNNTPMFVPNTTLTLS